MQNPLLVLFFVVDFPNNAAFDFTLMKTWVLLSPASEQNVVWSKIVKGVEQADR